MDDTTTTRELPILFNTPMVRAILEGRKTHTRRTRGLEDVNSYPGLLAGDSPLGPLGYRGLEVSDYYLKPPYKREFRRNPGIFHWFLGMKPDGKEINPIPVKCPYGQVGDRLWVRETWAAIWPDEDPVPLEQCNVEYRADTNDLYPGEWPAEEARGNPDAPKWRPSIFMPRWASRTTLEVVNVRVERVQDISMKDCLREGVTTTEGELLNGSHLVYAFRELWDSINNKGDYGWNINPWVWVIEFRRIAPAAEST